MPSLLIVNADDFGLTEGVSPGDPPSAHRRHRHVDLGAGARARVRQDGRAGWPTHPALGLRAPTSRAVGEDPPLLSAGEIPTLVTKAGAAARRRGGSSCRCAAARRIDPDDLRREFGAQLERIAEAGVTIDHLDTHQNLHLWPMVRTVVMELGAAAGVRTIRVTRSAASSVVGTRRSRRLSARLEAAADRRGWRYPAAIDRARRGRSPRPRRHGRRPRRRLRRRAPASAELATHPGEAGDADLARYRWGYQWPDELAALCSADRPKRRGRARLPPRDLRRPAEAAPSAGGARTPSPATTTPRGRPPPRAHALVDRARSTPSRRPSRPCGRVLEVGCGHGLVSLYLAECEPSATVVGIDVDADKIAHRPAARRPPTGPRVAADVRLRAGRSGAVPRRRVRRHRDLRRPVPAARPRPSRHHRPGRRPARPRRHDRDQGGRSGAPLEEPVGDRPGAARHPGAAHHRGRAGRVRVAVGVRRPAPGRRPRRAPAAGRSGLPAPRTCWLRVGAPRPDRFDALWSAR